MLTLRKYLNLDFDLRLRTELTDMIEQKYISATDHPTEPLTIFNYTAHAVWAGVWNDCTLKSRGLIVDRRTGEVVARPFPKFFNYGEPRSRITSFEGPIRVQEKMDGSLGILYQEPISGRYKIATRGSFQSEQAIHASQILQAKYGDFLPYAGFTYLFEIIYPQNRIVVDYGPMDDLVLLDVINNETGLSALGAMVDLGVPFPVAPKHSYSTVEEVVQYFKENPDQKNTEGVVIYLHQTGERLKVKYDEYKRLHKLLTGVTEKTIWEHLSTSTPLDDLLDLVPDEFYSWVEQTSNELLSLHQQISKNTWEIFRGVWRTLDLSTDNIRKEFALAIKDSAWKDILFAYYDEKDVSPLIWKRLKPKGAATAFKSQHEDVQ